MNHHVPGTNAVSGTIQAGFNRVGITAPCENRVEIAMSSYEQSVADAWATAAADLRIQVTAPFRLKTNEGVVIEWLALIHNFGSSQGTLICTASRLPEVQSAGQQCGFFVSGLYAHAYSSYDRKRFQETLEDWGWYGDSAPPNWYRARSPWESESS